tara:strand:+ start:1025 stop:1714 length:690 start_codon:yes stop_codon:yes gene_type:complete
MAASPDPARTKSLGKFSSALSQFLSTLHQVFPDCEKTTEFYLKFDAGKLNDSIQQDVIQKWHGHMQPYYIMCMGDCEEDWDMIMALDSPLLHGMNFYGKWKKSGLDASSKDHLKQYIRVLNKHAGIYCGSPLTQLTRHIPKGMMDAIMSCARQNVDMVRDGGGGIESMNLEEISSSIVESITEDDLDAFQQAMPQIIKDLANVTEGLEGTDADAALQALGPLTNILGGM